MRWTRPFWVLIAIIVLVETWLWEHIGPLIRRLVDLLPLARLKAVLAAAIARLPPVLTLVVFLVPVLVILPFKLLGLKLIATGHVALGVITFVVAKSLGVGSAAFLFDVCRPQLMRLRGFVWLYEHWLVWAAWAHQIIDPIKARISAILREVWPRNGRISRFIARVKAAERRR